MDIFVLYFSTRDLFFSENSVKFVFELLHLGVAEARCFKYYTLFLLLTHLKQQHQVLNLGSVGGMSSYIKDLQLTNLDSSVCLFSSLI